MNEEHLKSPGKTMNIHRELAILRALTSKAKVAADNWQAEVKEAAENGEENAWPVEAAIRVHLAMSELVRQQEQRIAEAFEKAGKP